VKKQYDPFAPTPEGFHLRVEQTLNGLEEREMTRRKFTASMAIALAVVMITATAFAASVYFGGTVDWKGNLTPYTEDDYLELSSLATPSPTQFSEIKTLDEVLQNIPEGEYWEFRAENESHGRFGNNDLRINSAEDMQQILTSLNLPVPMLNNDFSFSSGYVFYDANPFCEEPYSVEEIFNGTLYKYRLSKESNTGGMGFYIDLLNDNESILVNAYSHPLTEDYNDYATTVELNETAIALSVPGYDAICIEGSDDSGFHRVISLQKLDTDRRTRIDIYSNCESISVEELTSLFG